MHKCVDINTNIYIYLYICFGANLIVTIFSYMFNEITVINS